ncbi:Gmad2 immunoglobulin-like domain-containing protein [Phytohabitans rumicis]|uniref:GerMN domain-containing protein n=1 Tax=Phytohabitans rumicis TaxID=1076125 RepID=A0A6V8KS74_9ACTN|nr:Gmad2 immunoglobulin-like domain-containing protein [Phytohabitans rumicis]GFJ87992.1 hypothetical protein Prum_016340 [Phytohabitans rumicis]
MTRDEEVLRRVLESEAAKVEVRPDALSAIRARTARRRRWLPFGAVVFTAATATAATLVVVGLVARPAPRQVAPDPGAVTAPASPPPATPSPSGSDSFSGTPSAALAIYYVAGERLYREFHRLPAGDGSAPDKIRAAVREMLEPETASDPDYTSDWPAGVRVRDVSVDGSAVTVDLSAAPPNDLAAQQLVWTVAAVVGGDPSVRVRRDGQSVDTLRKAPAVDTLAAVWLIEPQHGSTVAKTFEAHVAGAVFEATAHLRVRMGDTVVTEKVLTLSQGAPSRGEAKVTLTLAPGTYTVEAYEISARDGSVQHLDGHTVTVR